MLSWFGTPWRRDLRERDRVEVPVGKRCGLCAKAVQPGDSGLLATGMEGDRTAYHDACARREGVEPGVAKLLGL